ncbi:MAG: hypothetical protein IPJ09_13185 [Saprospiraceae bacterium]|nr:hypothetical protein [Saprospiraceae bacterium]
MLPHTPSPVPTAGRPEGEVNRTSGNAIGYLFIYCCLASAHPQPPEGEFNRTSFHYQWLLLSCFRSPPDPMPTASRPEGEVNRTSLVLVCTKYI